MHLEHLELVEFRSYARAEVVLGPGVQVFIGPNARGKTNLLEAVAYLATGGSHRTASDTPLVRVGAEAAVIRARARLTADAASVRRTTVEVEIRPRGRNRTQVDGQPQRRLRDAFGVVRAVLFAPEDLLLVRGDPADRRTFLDVVLGQRRPAYTAARLDYERVLRQRNALLRAARRGPPAPVDTATWTDALVSAAAPLLAARVAAVHALAQPLAEAYGMLVAGTEATADVRLSYQLSTGRTIAGETGASKPEPAELAEELRAGLTAVAGRERERGQTLAGPHRDELLLQIGSLPAKGYASHGEQWSLALALRLASRSLLAEVGEEPVVLLDDVFAELDDLRRARLAGACAAFEQVLVTAAVEADVPLAGPRHQVPSGVVAAGAEAGDA